MWRSVVFKKFTEINTRPQVFLSLNGVNGPEMLSSSKMAFCCKSIVFCLIPFLFLEIQIIGVKNSRHKSGSVHKPPSLCPPRV